MAEDVADDVRQIFGCDCLLFIAQFDDAVGDFAHGSIVQINAESLQILFDVCFA
ncbi:hypothetical protein Barb7_02967 [Bacteroidales bacterium Barb7]|nr:hypothetical protein Barb7_02967 [Bacteroidales bacterium Barb7]